MTAWLDALLPPLDRALGFYLLLAALAGLAVGKVFDRARREPPPPDPHAAAYGDVTRLPRRP
jgi:hypothetical protein